MKILLLCGSVKPGEDGVGDYSRRLCGELSRMGHKAEILSLCDTGVGSYISEIQHVEGTSVTVTRIPIDSFYKQRLAWLQEIVIKVNPEVISLQYVPYSFSAKGLPFWLPSYLKKVRGNHKWHIMFHELWVGIDIESSLKHKFIGALQQFIAKKVVQNTKANSVSTQNKLYQFHLSSNNIKAKILPICGNIPLTGKKNNAKDFTQFVLFGSIHYGAPFMDFVGELKDYSSQFDKPIKFIFIGKNGDGLSEYTQVIEKHAISYEVLGIESEEVISQVLLDSDFGISTTPYFQTEKSGVYAAYREHQLTTICVARNWTPITGQYTIPQIIRYKKNNLNFKPVEAKMFDLESLAKQFINLISLS